MSELHEIVATLARRVQALEDELAIHRLMASYGLAVDTGDAERTAALFAEDAVYDVDVLVMHGRDDVRAMVTGTMHQALLPNCAHQMGPAVVEVAGDRATATGYSRVYLRKGDAVQVYRVSFNRWEFERRNGHWQVVRRTTRLLGHPEAARLFAPAEAERTDRTAD